VDAPPNAEVARVSDAEAPAKPKRQAWVPKRKLTPGKLKEPAA
jgi:hypothetical protein